MSKVSTVIGGRGYIGTALTQFLRARGHQVLVPEKGSAELFGRELGQVFYCAGYTNDYNHDPSATVEAHAGLLSRLFKEGEFEHLVYLSSTRLYDDMIAELAGEDSIFALDPKRERHLYDLSKLLGEWLCLNLAPGRSAIARLSCVYSDDLDVPAFLPLLVRRLTHYGVASIPSWPDTARDYVHMDDVCQALLAIADNRAAGIFNVASGENVSNLALCRRILETTGLEVVMTPPDAEMPDNPPRIAVERLKKQLALNPRSVLDVIPEIIRAHLSSDMDQRSIA